MMFYDAISKCSPELMNKSINSLVNSLKRNQKIMDNEEDMEKMYNIQRELFASKSKDVFDEFRSLKKTVAYRYIQMLHSFFDILLNQDAIHKLASPTVPRACCVFWKQKKGM